MPSSREPPVHRPCLNASFIHFRPVSIRPSTPPPARTCRPIKPNLSVCLYYAIFSLLSSIHSEDYYGDLDLKSIRKSELLAGLQNTDQSRAIASKAAAAKSQRPTAAKEA